MIKKLLKISWKITKFVTKVIMILIFTIGLFTINGKVNKLAKIVDEQYLEVDERYNQVIDNEIELLKQIQENFNNSDLTDKELLAKVIVIDNAIKDLKENRIDIQKLLKSDVFVMDLFGEGAGTIIKKTNTNMYILTCAHVVQNIYGINQYGMKMAVTIGYSKTDEKDKIGGLIVYGTEIIAYDEENDLALLKTSIVDDNLEVVNLAETEPEKGDKVYSIGSPLGLYRTISAGIISNKLEGFYFSDQTTTFGNSGGGLYNAKGELIGIPSNVIGYAMAKRLGYEKYLQNEEGKFIPETSLGLSISLFRIKEFLRGINY